jgi:hypothetical protein
MKVSYNVEIKFLRDDKNNWQIMPIPEKTAKYSL